MGWRRERRKEERSTFLSYFLFFVCLFELFRVGVWFRTGNGLYFFHSSFLSELFLSDQFPTLYTCGGWDDESVWTPPQLHFAPNDLRQTG